MKSGRFSKSLSLVAPVVGLVASEVDAAAYIKFDGVEGEVTDTKFEGFIKLNYFKIEIEGTSDGLTRSVVHRPPAIGLAIDKSSPILMLSCATGQVIPVATIVLTKSAGDGTEVVYYKVTMENVQVSSFSTSKSADSEQPVEALSLNYEKIEWTYSAYSPSGENLGSTTTGELTVPRE